MTDQITLPQNSRPPVSIETLERAIYFGFAAWDAEGNVAEENTLTRPEYSRFKNYLRGRPGTRIYIGRNSRVGNP